MNHGLRDRFSNLPPDAGIMSRTSTYGRVDEFLEELVTRIDRHIEMFLPRVLDDRDVERYIGPPRGRHAPDAHSAGISQPMWDLISRKGKRWRPGFCGLLLESLGTSSSGYEDLLFVLPELLHTAALIIDDIEDASPIRRGQESIHLRYGVDVALNAANTVYFLPFRIIAEQPRLSTAQRLQLYELLHRVFLRSHFGQSMDIHLGRAGTRETLGQRLEGPLADTLLQTHALKTGAFSEGLAEMAAILAATDDRTYRACATFGLEFGIAFQIMDDVRNFSNSPGWTKVPGEDLIAGKITYVIVRALERLPDRDRGRLAAILCSQALRGDSRAIDEGIRLIQESGALAACRDEARAIFDRAWTDLACLLPASDAKAYLRPFFFKVLELPYDP